MVFNHYLKLSGEYKEFESRVRRRGWDEVSYTVDTRWDINYLHPGAKTWEVEEMFYDVTPKQPANGYKVVELFAGGGLMAVGLKMAGYNIIWANDFDPDRNPDKEQPQVKTYRYNIGNHIVQKDVTTLTMDEIPDSDILAGGPPCQDFSIAGSNKGEDGEKGKLVWTYLEIIKGKQPKAFIFENVKNLIHKHRHTFDALIEQFKEIGYNVSWKLVNAWDYGIAQKRERVFVVGIREDLGFTFEFPEPKPEDYRTQVLRDVIGDLPTPLKNHDTEKAVISGKAMEGYERRYGDGKIGGGFALRPNEWDEPSPTIFGRIGNEGKAFIHPNHNENSYWTPKNEYAYSQENRVQNMDEPSNTIPAHHNSGQPQHPTEAPRRFTVRECLRIQSVPDWYVIPEDIALGAQYKIVGNGVASKVAYVLGDALNEQLRAAEEIQIAYQQAAAAGFPVSFKIKPKTAL